MHLGIAALPQLLKAYGDAIQTQPRTGRASCWSIRDQRGDRAGSVLPVGLAALTLVTTTAQTRRPLLMVVDDTQWLDQESADVLGFFARRLYADRGAGVASVRDPIVERRVRGSAVTRPWSVVGVSVGGALGYGPPRALDRPPSTASTADWRWDRSPCADPTSNASAGSRLWLAEKIGAFGLSEPDVGSGAAAQLAGADHFSPSHWRSIGDSKDASSVRLVRSPLPPRASYSSQQPSPLATRSSIWRAGRELDFDEHAMAPAQAVGLLEVGPKIVFRHPLIRSAVYQGASHADRCRAHAALVTASDAARNPTGGRGIAPQQSSSPMTGWRPSSTTPHAARVKLRRAGATDTASRGTRPAPGALRGEHGPAILSRDPGGVTSGCVHSLRGWHRRQPLRSGDAPTPKRSAGV